MRHVQCGEVSLAYEESGSGSPLVQIHGAGFGHHNFGSLTPYLERHFHIMNIDQRGFGESDRPDGPYSFEVWADDVARFLDARDVDQAHVHGTSMGGPVALTFASRHPDRVLGLVVSCALVAPDRFARISYELVRRLAAAFGLGSMELAELISLYCFSREYLEGDDGAAAIEQTRTILATNNSPDVFDQAWARLIEMDLGPLLPTVVAPALVLAGADDFIITPDRMAGGRGGSKDLCERLPTAELSIVHGCSHALLFERPGECASAIIGFLRRVEADGLLPEGR